MDSCTVQQALTVFGLNDTLTIGRLQERYRELCHTWHPHRYASLTNNSQKYMAMYKKGEVKTKEIQAAYHVLMAWLKEREQHSVEAEKDT